MSKMVFMLIEAELTCRVSIPRHTVLVMRDSLLYVNRGVPCTS
jgi:hypothetical protein